MSEEIIPSSALVLAYLGDAVIELFVRERLSKTGISNVGELNRLSRNYVQASRQSRAIENILPVLTEKEIAVYKHGRNAHTSSHPKSSSVVEYRRATGFETLMGYLYSSGNTKRARELFELAYGIRENEEL